MPEMPLFPLNVVLFPGMPLPLHIFEPRYRLMIGICLDEQREFGVVLIRSGSEVGGPAVPYDIGTSARIVQAERLEDGRMNILTQGVRRFRILRIIQETPFMAAEVEMLESQGKDNPQVPALAQRVASLFTDYYRLQLALSNQWMRTVPYPRDPDALADLVAERLTVSHQQKQKLLEALDVGRRLEIEEALLEEERREMQQRVKMAQRARWAGFGALN